MALLATFEAPPCEGTTFGGFGAVAIATGSRGRVTTGLIAEVWTSLSRPPRLVWLTPRRANLDRQRNFAASRRYEITQNRISSCCIVSYSSGYCPLLALPYGSATVSTPIDQCLLQQQ